MGSRVRLLGIRNGLVAFCLWAATTLSLGEVTTEPQLKAAFLVNFLKYVEWPVNKGTVTICLVGRDGLGSALAAYEGRSIGGRELHVRRINGPDQLADCQELFIPESEEARFSLMLRWVEAKPVLTVSDSELFVREGGAISLVRGDGRLFFDVNVDALGKAGLRASSQMLRLARQVQGGGR